MLAIVRSWIQSVWDSEVLERYGVILMAVVVYLLFLAAIAVSASFIAKGLDEGTTPKVEETKEGVVTKTVITEETTRSIPMTALLTVLGVGGVAGAVIIPLTFLWDEMSNRAQNRRQAARAMRERLHPYVEKYYVPMSYALSDLAKESQKWAKEITSGKLDGIVFDRWLYSVAGVWRVYRNMRHEGGSWFFRSHLGEDQVQEAFKNLTSMLDSPCEQKGLERSLLVSGLDGLEPRDFGSFRARLLPLGCKSWWTQDPWKELRRHRKSLLARCRSPNAADYFEDVRTAAEHTARLIQFHGTAIYRPWYRDMTLKRDLERVKKAQKWVRMRRKKECAGGDRGGTSSTQVDRQSSR